MTSSNVHLHMCILLITAFIPSRCNSQIYPKLILTFTRKPYFRNLYKWYINIVFLLKHVQNNNNNE